MSRRCSFLVFSAACLGALLSLVPARADAACSTSTSLKAYGDWWIERSGASCDCVFKAQKHTCGTSGGFRTQDAATTITTLAGDCSKACADISGYEASVATVLGKYAPTTGNYECDSTFTDNDGDFVGTCIDESDSDPRKAVKINASEKLCDGFDNDNDSTVDDGFTACEKDHKRAADHSRMQGDGTSSVNLIEGSLLRVEPLTSVLGAYGALPFTLFYDSRREDDTSGLGRSWSSNFSVYLKQMPSGDDRYMVQLGNAELYFRCFTISTNKLCEADDHHPGGWLKQTSGAFEYFVGDGTRYTWDDSTFTSRRLFKDHLDEAGNLIARATPDGSERPTKVESANSSIYLSLTYATNGLDVVRVSSTTANQILDLDVLITSGVTYLDKIKFAETLNSVGGNTYIAYSYNATSHNLETVSQLMTDGSSALTMGSFTHDGSDRALTLKDASKDLSIDWTTATQPIVTYNVATGSSPTVTFTSNGLWMKTRNSDLRLGGMGARTEVRDAHGRVTCSETDDSRMTKLIYTDSRRPIRADFYGKTGDCTSGGTVDHKRWFSWELGSSSKAWREKWVRLPSIYSPASDCSGGSLPSGCAETKYDYVSSSDDRLQWVTRTGTTRLASSSTSQKVAKTRFYYFGLDTSKCASSGDWYTGLLCFVETQDDAGTPNVFTRAEYHYVASGSTGGSLKTIKRHDKSSDAAPLTTSFASHNVFGSPGSVTDEAGVVTDYVYNGWNAATSVTENDALITDSDTLLDPVTTSSFNRLRRVDTVVLPKGNKQITKYLTGATDYGRVKAFANADSTGALQEIIRYEHDKFGNSTEEKIVDSINGTTPCADEDCATLESRSQRDFDVRRRIKNQYLHASDTADPADATMTFSYTNGQVTQVLDYLGIKTVTAYDDQGRLSTRSDDDGGLSAATTFTYDANGRVATITGPNGVVTTKEHDDFGRLVLERSKTRGDMRFEYDTAGRSTKRRRSDYNASTNQEDTCYTTDWLGRQLTVDYGCDGVNANLYYDGDSLPASSCRTGSVQTGRLSTITNANFTRVLCWHPNGQIQSVFQIPSSTWSNSDAKGSTRIYDANGGLLKEYVWDRPSGHTVAREIEYVHSDTMLDRVRYVHHKLASSGTWIDVTSTSVDPTYFAFGGFKSLKYANGVDETTTHDKAYRTTRKKTAYSSTTMTDVNLTWDNGGSITLYDDSAGYRHLKYYAAYDTLHRLRCVSRASIGSCSGSEPWEDKFEESFDFDASGNRTNRRYGAFNTDDDDAYTYVTQSDIIDKVTSGGATKEMSNDQKGDITTVNQPENIQYGFDFDGKVKTSNDNSLGAVNHDTADPFSDRYQRTAVCNSRTTRYYYSPTGAGGASHELKLLDEYGTCATEYPRRIKSFVYLEGRPIAVLHAERASSGSDALTEKETYWIHTDHLGTPILVSDTNHIERWRWENSAFGTAPPIEFTVTGSDINPDDSTGNPYKTCCCAAGGCGAGCNQCTTGCSAGQCSGGLSQDVVWNKTYTPNAGAGRKVTAVRLHFSSFDLKPGTSRTGKDYLRLYKSDGSTVIGTYTGNLGAFWSAWVPGISLIAKLTADNVADGTVGFVVDSIEYTSDVTGGASEQYVLIERFPGQIYDEDAKASYNWHRWYRAEDGRYLSPDPIGLKGGEAGYFAYAGSNPSSLSDPSGLCNETAPCDVASHCCGEVLCGPGPNQSCCCQFAQASACAGRQACMNVASSAGCGCQASASMICDCLEAGENSVEMCSNLCIRFDWPGANIGPEPPTDTRPEPLPFPNLPHLCRTFVCPIDEATPFSDPHSFPSPHGNSHLTQLAGDLPGLLPDEALLFSVCCNPADELIPIPEGCAWRAFIARMGLNCSLGPI